MSENLPAQLSDLESIPSTVDQTALNAIANGPSNFLPRIQLATSNSNLCGEQSIQINHYALIRDRVAQDIGTEVDAVVLAGRPMAIEYGEEVVVCFDPQLDENNQFTGLFAQIQHKADNVQDSGCQWGTQYLLWIPEYETFATFFLGTKSARREIPSIQSRMRQAVTIGSKRIETKKYKWQAPSIQPCSADLSLPSIAELREQIEKFENPPKPSVESVTSDEVESRER